MKEPRQGNGEQPGRSDGEAVQHEMQDHVLDPVTISTRNQPMTR
ncbi:Uncharacterised protein [Chlamydia abortus]|nr:hypothetical protein [Paenibacillus sp. 32O-W]SHE12605.1 Uncharacterised protein [Chlamydia abortus]